MHLSRQIHALYKSTAAWKKLFSFASFWFSFRHTDLSGNLMPIMGLRRVHTICLRQRLSPHAATAGNCA